MILRATTVTLGFAAAAVMLCGCLAPAPEPTPTPTAVFASEDEAFAAAEETYRAYVDAANARREDPDSEPDPQSFLVGDALERDVDSRRELAELGLQLVGSSSVTDMSFISADVSTGDVVIQACYDSGGARVIDKTGVDVTPADRDATVMISIESVRMGDRQIIESMSPVEGDPC
ncbi:hypothetical protein [Microbacterium kyungheense]|uniref:Uncharacterized protein n=1 Tax=Microbacterium kyungheense TaxID=1263636 RepID=A0A543FMW3_9MICO|nr:hypothetical protein [Microbacterium kyungheense]TQM35014.1 hypothetical protein FB391_1310 [Microbacterium kyungheense]